MLNPGYKTEWGRLVAFWEILRAHPTLNDWQGRPSWRYYDLRNIWRKEFPPAMPKAAMLRVVRIQRVMGPKERRYDDENLHGGVKPIRDALRYTGWILDDSPKWCRTIFEPEVKEAKRMSRIWIYEPPETAKKPPHAAGKGVTGDERG